MCTDFFGRVSQNLARSPASGIISSRRMEWACNAYIHSMSIYFVYDLSWSALRNVAHPMNLATGNRLENIVKIRHKVRSYVKMNRPNVSAI